MTLDMNNPQQDADRHSRIRADETIQVRRIRQRPSTEQPVRSRGLEPTPAPPENGNIEAENENAAPEELLEPDGRSQWELEQNEEAMGDEDQYEASELSESASVFTLYFSQQETIISNGETEPFSREEEKEEEIVDEQGEEYKFRFNRAQSGKNERSRSAPARPLTEMEEFKESKEFISLEAAAVDAGDLLQKIDGKLDLDSMDGHGSCKKFLEHIEELATQLGIKCATRKYRSNFSQAYKVLYKENSLCYLTEILDSAQEGRTK